MLHPNFVFIGSILNLIGSVSYIIAMFKGQARPNRVSWFLWSAAPLIAFAAELTKGVGLVSLMTFMVGFSPLLVFLASFLIRKAYWRITTFDWWCGGLSLAALVLWAITREGNIGIFFAIAADALASVPTIIKSYREPASESPTLFILASLSALLATLTITNWNFAHYSFPVYILFINTLMAVLILYPRKKVAPV